jgi:glyoxylate reductase
MARVLVTRRLVGDGLALLGDHELVYLNSEDRPLTHDELCEASADVDAIVCVLTDRIDAEVLAAGQGRLKVVANVAVGFDNIDIAAAQRCGVAVCNTPGVLDDTTADLAFLLILAASRLSSDAERTLRTNGWKGFRIDQFLGRDVSGMRLGLVGYGRIARRVAVRAAGFGMKLVVHSRTDPGEVDFEPDLDRMISRVDIVSLHVPGTPETKHLFDARRIGLMDRNMVLVNTARGSVVDEEALARALDEGRLHAAGIDVFEREPAVDPRLLAAPRTVLLPHIGSASHATRGKMVRLAAQGAADVLARRRPANLVTSA